MKIRALLVAALAAALTLSACSGDDTESSTGATDEATATETDRSYDVSGVAKVDEIAALLPADIAEEGKLVIGASIDYAPAEFRAEDLQTAIGYDVDLGKAIGNVLGVETEVSAADFASILPGIGTKYDIGISSFTIDADRTASYNMVSYIMVGSSYAVQSGNPRTSTLTMFAGKPLQSRPAPTRKMNWEPSQRPVRRTARSRLRCSAMAHRPKPPPMWRAARPSPSMPIRPWPPMPRP